MSYQPKEGYPDDKMAMGQFLGPAIDIGNAMTYKINFPDGNYVYRLTVRPWMLFEKANPAFLANCEKYMSQVHEALGAAYTVGYFLDDDLTPEFDYYADNVEDCFRGILMRSYHPRQK